MQAVSLSLRWAARWGCVLGLVGLLGGCQAIYPEVKTPMRPPLAGQVLQPSPPADLRWISFKGASIPPYTRDGRRWGNDLGAQLPDPYAVLYVNDVELLRTTIQHATLSPTWPDAPSGNFRLSDNDRLRVEVWDARVIHDHPIGIRDINTRDNETQLLNELEVECDSGVKVQLAIEPARGWIGFGFYYEFRTYDVFVTRVFEESPAARAGIRSGDQILSVMSRPLRGMKDGEVQSLFNAPRIEGLALVVHHEDGSEASLTLKEGAVYPLFREVGSLR